jgi:MFS family permease
MLAWYKELKSSERRTFWSCFGGWALDSFDVQLFTFVLPALMLTMGFAQDKAGLLGTVSLIASAFGGWIAGGLADRYGRVRVLQGCILWYSVATGLAAFAQSFEQLLVLRALQGLGFGGEWAAGAVLIGEMIRPQNRGKAVGMVQSAYAVGWFAAAAVSTFFIAFLPPETAWRVVFATGLLPALLVLYIRRNVSEPPLFKRDVQREGQFDKRGLFAIFERRILRTTLLACLLAAGVQGSSHAIIFWLPTFLATARELSAVQAGSYVMVTTLGSFFGYLCSAYLTDAIGRRPNLMFYVVGCLVVDFTYFFIPGSNIVMLLLGIPLGFFSQGIYASLGPYFTELFPTSIRATGQAFAYNFGRMVGALFIGLIGYLSHSMPLHWAMGALSLGGYALAVVATLLLPETRGRALDDDRTALG